MLIDEYMPVHDFAERHEKRVRAPKAATRRAVDTWRPQDSLLWRLLLRLRGLGSPSGSLRNWAEANGFLLLGETEDEALYGQAGRFWALDERRALVSPRTVEEFRRLDDPRYVVAVMNVVLEEVSADETRIRTETRVRALGASSRRRFRIYWLLIRPFSGLLRRAMLAGISRRALLEGRVAP